MEYVAAGRLIPRLDSNMAISLPIATNEKKAQPTETPTKWRPWCSGGTVRLRVVGHFNYVQEPQTVYETFTDREALLYSTPGLRALDEVARDQYDAVLRIGVGGFELIYTGRLSLSDRVPNQQYRFLVDATTQHGGYGHGEAVFRFLPGQNGGTRVEYDADVELGGGQKLLPSLARGLVDFFMRGMSHWMHEMAAGRRPEQ
jgi:carbon monoxide dehydrogenase subunit G